MNPDFQLEATDEQPVLNGDPLLEPEPIDTASNVQELVVDETGNILKIAEQPRVIFKVGDFILKNLETLF